MMLQPDDIEASEYDPVDKYGECEPGTERCSDCGFVMPSEDIEHVEDANLGRCKECVSGN